MLTVSYSYFLDFFIINFLDERLRICHRSGSNYMRYVEYSGFLFSDYRCPAEIVIFTFKFFAIIGFDVTFSSKSVIQVLSTDKFFNFVAVRTSVVTQIEWKSHNFAFVLFCGGVRSEVRWYAYAFATHNTRTYISSVTRFSHSLFLYKKKIHEYLGII